MNSQETFKIVTVCTGNIARSPLTEQLLASRLARAGSLFEVSSAGTAAVVGAPMTDEAAALSATLGGDPSHHRGRALTAEIIDEADLVLTATRDHRSAVVAMLPRASRYSFTVRQFVRLLDSLDPSVIQPLREPVTERAGRLVLEAAAQRGYLPPLAEPSDDDIEDPYRRSAQTYTRVAAHIDDATSRIAAALIGVDPAAGTGAPRGS